MTHACILLRVDKRSAPAPADRYEPVPGIIDFPAWIWRRLPGPGKVAVILLPIVLIVVGIALRPGIEDSKQERARSEEQRIERERAAREAALREQQQPRFASGPAAPNNVVGRERLVTAAGASVLVDARRRAAAGELDGPVRDVTCEPFPRSVSGRGADQDLSKRAGSYSCLAVTARFGGSQGGEREAYAQSEAGAIGHPYRVRIDFSSGRYAFCRVAGRAGEGGLQASQAVTVPRVCGGL
jgi:hypothetical protein